MRRVVVTGMGAITPIGNDVNTFWNNIKLGTCSIDFIKNFDTEDFKVKLAAEVKDFEPSNVIEKRELKRMDKYCQFDVVAADEAIKDANLNLDNIDKEKFGVIVGSGIGGIETIEKQCKVLEKKGPNRVHPLFIPMIISNMASGNIAIRYGAKGICTTVVTACATGTNSIGGAYRMIQNATSEIMIAGGTEAAITPLAISYCTK